MLAAPSPNLAPSVCFVCEQANPVRYVDTLRSFETGVHTHLSGRKYVCETCVRSFVTVLDLDNEINAPFRERIADIESELETLHELADLSKVAEGLTLALKQYLPAKPKPVKA